MSNYDADTIKGLLLLTIIAISISYLIHLGYKRECKNQAVSFDNYEYKLFGGCMVEHKGKWLPLKNVREFTND